MLLTPVINIDPHAAHLDENEVITGAWTFNDDVLINGISSFNPVLELRSTHNSAYGGLFIQSLDSETPANGDLLGLYQFKGNDSVGLPTSFCELIGSSLDITDGEESGAFYIDILIDNVLRNLLTLSGYNGIVGQGEILLNPAEQDIDTIISALGVTNALFVQGSTGFIGLGTNLPDKQFHQVPLGEAKISSVVNTNLLFQSNQQYVAEFVTNAPTFAGFLVRSHNATGSPFVQLYNTITTDIWTIMMQRTQDRLQFIHGNAVSGEIPLTLTSPGNNLRVGVHQVLPTAQLEIVTYSATDPGLKVKGSPSQSADLVRVTDSSDNIGFKIDADFDVVIGSGETGKDYSLTFHGENNDGVLTWMEDEDRFDFSDSVKINGLLVNTTAKTSAYTATKNDDFIACDATSGGFPITLPVTSGKVLHIKKIDSSANAVTIAGTGDELPYNIVNQFESISLIYDSAKWWMI